MAVAENQPQKNRMSDTLTFDAFSAQWRSWIARPPLHSPEEDAEFNALALALFRLQFNAIPIYQRVCERRGLSPDTVTHWSQIPALPTRSFKDMELTSLPPEERVRVFHSSGTSGQTPSRHFHSAASLALYETALRPWFQRHFLPATQPSDLDAIILSPEPEQAPHSSLVHMFQSVEPFFSTAVYTARADAEGAWVLESDRVISRLEQGITNRRPMALLGTAFSFVHLIDALKAAGRRLSLPAGSRVFETGGYKGRSRALTKEELRRLITRSLNVPNSQILSEYGMSELSSQAYDGVIGEAAASTRIFHFPPWVRTRIVSPETGEQVAEGETGLLQILDLANVRSLLAIQTEDLALRRGDGFELLGRAADAEPRGCSLLPASQPMH